MKWHPVVSLNYFPQSSAIFWFATIMWIDIRNALQTINSIL